MRSTALSLAVLGLATVASAQTPTALQHAALVTPRQNDAYVYQSDGRRDPFQSLVHSGEDPKSAMKHDGLRTFMLAEISVRGVMQTKEALVAMVQGPDNRTYVIHRGDKLADAVVKSVTAQGLVAMQDVSDPLSVQKQREVRKWLRSLEGTEK
ncbi:MAG: pilus assembly protein PilP [Vicinamibacterales bacterium]